MMTFGYSFNIWVPLLLFPTAGPDGAPRWRKGWPVTFVFYFLLWAGFVASILIYRHEKKRDATVSSRESNYDGEGETVVQVGESTKNGS